MECRGMTSGGSVGERSQQTLQDRMKAVVHGTHKNRLEFGCGVHVLGGGREREGRREEQREVEGEGERERGRKDSFRIRQEGK
jgi:hypothetical protein